MELDGRPDGIVFVSYAHDDFDRIKPLADKLAERFNLFIDRQSLKAGEYWRQGLTEGLRRARCVLGLFTRNLDVRSFALDEMTRAQSNEILLPVKLDAEAEIHLGFERNQYVDLSGWNGETEPLSELFSRIREMLKNSPHSLDSSSPPPPDLNWAVSNSSHALDNLRGLANQVATIGGVLAGRAGPVLEVNASLKEIHATCSATLQAIDRFLEPMDQPEQSDLKAYLMVPGELSDLVRDKGGHCTRILEIYYRLGGVRDWLLQHAEPELVKQSDDAFSRLANADHDLFANIQEVGAMLDAEVTSVRELLLRGKKAEARERLTEGQIKLLQHRRELNDFISRFTAEKIGMGYTRDG
jgi:hypothetical protein